MRRAQQSDRGRRRRFRTSSPRARSSIRRRAREGLRRRARARRGTRLPRARDRTGSGGSQARAGRSVPGLGARCRSACRASDVARGSMTTSMRAAASRFLDERHEVDAGSRRVDAPQHDQPRVEVVLVRDARHLAVERQVGGAGRRGADRSREPRRAERRETTAHRSCPASAGRSIRRSRTAGCASAPMVSRMAIIRCAICIERFVPGHADKRSAVPWVLCGPPDRADGPPRTSARRSGEPSRR